MIMVHSIRTFHIAPIKMAELLKPVFFVMLLCLISQAGISQEKGIVISSSSLVYEVDLDTYERTLIKDLELSEIRVPMLSADSVLYFEYKAEEQRYLGSYDLKSDTFSDLGRILFSESQQITRIVGKLDDNTLLLLVQRFSGGQWYRDFYHFKLAPQLQGILLEASLDDNYGVLHNPFDGSIWTWKRNGSQLELARYDQDLRKVQDFEPIIDIPNGPLTGQENSLTFNNKGELMFTHRVLSGTELDVYKVDFGNNRMLLDGSIFMGPIASVGFVVPQQQLEGKWLAVTPPAYSFSAISDQPEVLTGPITIVNTGNEELSLDRFEFSNEVFEHDLPSLPLSLAPGQSARFSVILNASETATHNGVLEIIDEQDNLEDLLGTVNLNANFVLNKPLEEITSLETGRFYGQKDDEVLEVDKFLRTLGTVIPTCDHCAHAVSPTGHLFRTYEDTGLLQVVDAATGEAQMMAELPDFGRVYTFEFLNEEVIRALTLTDLYDFNYKTGELLHSTPMPFGASGPSSGFGPNDFAINPTNGAYCYAIGFGGLNVTNYTNLVFLNAEHELTHSMRIDEVIFSRFFYDVQGQLYGILANEVYRIHTDGRAPEKLGLPDLYDDIFGLGDLSTPDLGLFPFSLDFGDVLIDDQKQSTLTVKNNTDQAISIAQLSTPGDFTDFTIDVQAPFELAAGQSMDINFNFAPEAQLELDQYFKISYELGNNLFEDSVQVLGLGFELNRVQEDQFYGLTQIDHRNSRLHKVDPQTLSAVTTVDLDGPFNALSVNSEGILHAVADGNLYQLDPVSGGKMFVAQVFDNRSTSGTYVTSSLSSITFDYEGILHFNIYNHRFWTSPGSAGTLPTFWGSHRAFDLEAMGYADTFIFPTRNMAFNPDTYQYFGTWDNLLYVHSLWNDEQTLLNLPDEYDRSRASFTDIEGSTYLLIEVDQDLPHELFKVDLDNAELSLVGQMDLRYIDLESATAVPDETLAEYIERRQNGEDDDDDDDGVVTSIDDEFQKQLNVYPNPLSNSRMLNLQGLGGMVEQVTLHDLTGQKLGSFDLSGLSTATLNLSTVYINGPGICLLNFVDQNGQRLAYRKLMILD